MGFQSHSLLYNKFADNLDKKITNRKIIHPNLFLPVVLKQVFENYDEIKYC